MSGTAFHFFRTPIGRCAIIWRGAFVVGAALPDEDEERARLALQRRFPGCEEEAPPPAIAEAEGAVGRLLSGEPEDFAGILIDLGSLGAFERAVLEATSSIPAGETRTYGDIARAVGSPGAARAVGRALGANPIPIIVPCHRVLGSNGKCGGFSAPGGAATKLKMLEIEGARRGSEPVLFERLPWQAKSS